jgi:NitT/TauT family transport system permease protein
VPAFVRGQTLYRDYPIPKIAFLPVLMLLLGLGDTSKVILIITIIIFQILLGARGGVKEFVFARNVRI